MRWKVWKLTSALVPGLLVVPWAGDTAIVTRRYGIDDPGDQDQTNQKLSTNLTSECKVLWCQLPRPSVGALTPVRPPLHGISTDKNRCVHASRGCPATPIAGHLCAHQRPPKRLRNKQRTFSNSFFFRLFAPTNNK